MCCIFEILRLEKLGYTSTPHFATIPRLLQLQVQPLRFLKHTLVLAPLKFGVIMVVLHLEQVNRWCIKHFYPMVLGIGAIPIFG